MTTNKVGLSVAKLIVKEDIISKTPLFLNAFAIVNPAANIIGIPQSIS